MKNKTLGEKAAEELVDLIQEWGYKPGEKLPNEYELSAQLGVGRNTVREAVRVLASRNIVNIKQGAGTFISDKKGVVDDPLGFSFMKDRRKLVEDLMQIRSIIEPQIAALAAQNATPKDIEKLGEICKEIEQLIHEGKDFTKKDMDFHAQLGICSGNRVMTNLIPVICEGVTAFSSMVFEQERHQTIKTHREVFEAVKEGRAVEAQQAMMYHLLYNINRFKEEIDR